MSTKLDQSLDEIMTNTGATRGGARGARRGRGPRPARKPAAAPVGGIAKNTRAAKTAVRAAPTGPNFHRDSKIVVSNLPRDVDESQIKEYFAKSVGSVKKVDISYGPNGQSRGIANIVFNKSDGASKAVAALNGLLVDGRPMKIEVLVDASQAPAIAAPKGLSERIAQPKPHPKSVAAAKGATTDTSARGRGGKRGRGGRARTARPARKTAEELDTDMKDYFVAAAATADAAPAATGADAPMDDEIL